MSISKKRIVSGLLIVVVLVSMMGATVLASPGQARMAYCYVNTDGSNLNGRSGPGTEYSIICKYANGTALSWSVFPQNNATDSQGREWMNVRGKATTGEYVTSWVCEDYLLFVNDYSLRDESIANDIKVDEIIDYSDLPSVG